MFKWILTLLLGTSFVLASSNIKSVNFIQEGEISKLIIDLDKDTFVERIPIKKDKLILLDFKNTKAAKRYLRDIDTSEFKGSTVLIRPVKKIGTQNDLRFAIQLRDNVRSILEKRGSRVILNIENRFGVFSKQKIKKSEKNENIRLKNEVVNIPKSFKVSDILANLTQSGVKKYIGKKISINVNNMPYTDLLKIIAETSGFNIIIDEAVNGLKPLTLNLTNIPWDEALDTILGLGNLTATKRSNILTVETDAQARAKKLLEIQNKNASKIQEPLVTKVFPISYADTKNLAKIVTTYLTEKRGRIQEDTRTSQLIVTDTVETIERIKSIIRTLDTQEPQVLIEAKIVEANEGYEFRAGLSEGGLAASYDPFRDSGNFDPNLGSFSISSAPTSNSPTIFGASIAVFKRLLNLNFQLDLMESESKGRVVTSPKIITENNQKASIVNEETQPFRVVTRDQGGNLLETFEEAQANISLDVTPKVTNEGAIAMAVDITKGGFGTASAIDARPPTTTNKITTKVLVDNGSTVVIGGLYKTETSEVQSGIPFLKDLPLIGWLFRTAYNPTKRRSELIVFLTPRVINQKEAGLTNRNSSGLIE